MRNLLAMLGAAVVTVLAVGWYLDWFKVHKGEAQDGKQHYSVEVNTPKIGEDLHKGTEKLHGAIDRKFSKKSESLTPPTPPAPPALSDPMGQAEEAVVKTPPAVYTGTEKLDKTPEPPGVGPELTPPSFKPPKN